MSSLVVLLLFTLYTATRTTALSENVYESKVAVIGEVPYQAAVWSVHTNPLTGGLRYDFQCAGSVVGGEFVLTTITCAQSTSAQLAVSAGFVSRKDPSTKHINVTEVIKHSSFNASTKEHDVAILRITHGFSMSSNLSIIPLRDAPISPGTLCRISGWRQDILVTGVGLKFAGASVFDAADCEVSSVLEGGGESGKLCAGIPDSQLFQCLLGDEGGPMGCDGQLTGLLSYSPYTCMPARRIPGSFIDVASHRQWIEEAMGGVGSTTTTTSNVDTTTLNEVGTTTGVLGGEDGGNTLEVPVVSMVVFLSISIYSSC